MFQISDLQIELSAFAGTQRSSENIQRARGRFYK